MRIPYKRGGGFGEGLPGVALPTSETGALRKVVEHPGVIRITRIDGEDTGAYVVARHVNQVGLPSLWTGVYVPPPEEGSRPEGGGRRITHCWSGHRDYNCRQGPGDFGGETVYDMWADDDARLIDASYTGAAVLGITPNALETANRELSRLEGAVRYPEDELMGNPAIVEGTARRLSHPAVRAAAQFVIANTYNAGSY